MTQALKQAFADAATLTDDEQDRIASIVFEQLPGDKRWTELFADPRSDLLLERLAAEALEEDRRGETRPLEELLAEA